jgi:hypothetical protein
MYVARKRNLFFSLAEQYTNTKTARSETEYMRTGGVTGWCHSVEGAATASSQKSSPNMTFGSDVNVKV